MSEYPENKNWRKSSQKLLPLLKDSHESGKYDIYPSFNIPDNQIFFGYDSLAREISRYRSVLIDGYSGVFFNDFRKHIDSYLKDHGFNAAWTNTEDFFKDPGTINEFIRPFSGNNDPLFGKRCSLELEDFFEIDSLKSIPGSYSCDIDIIIGPGAFLTGREGLRIYIDIPKNEIQYRARSGSIGNFGHPGFYDYREIYKCFYFVDWPVLNRHKQRFLHSADIFSDGQRPDNPAWISGDDIRTALSEISRNPFRARPWFESGPWGGSWMKQNIPGINTDVPNYAWSFELISPENGLLLESSSVFLEVSFDCIMYLAAEKILGDCFDRFQYDFPIRFDFLDTMDGGNLSIQCHPRPEYIRNNFGENLTQEETYYILDNKAGSSVFLGFCEDADPDAFITALEKSRDFQTPFDTGKYILSLPSKKHDLFLIPYGTLHGSGKNNLVLEISTTPYIFTFKLYDWLRNDLDGRPRSLNIQRAAENLYFERKGACVQESFVSKPELSDSGKEWKLFHLPTHKTHLLDIMRYHFTGEIELETFNKCLVMNLVEGTTIDIVSRTGRIQTFSCYETFIIPAAAGKIKIYNRSATEAVLVYAFVK